MSDFYKKTATNLREMIDEINADNKPDAVSKVLGYLGKISATAEVALTPRAVRHLLAIMDDIAIQMEAKSPEHAANAGLEAGENQSIPDFWQSLGLSRCVSYILANNKVSSVFELREMGEMGILRMSGLGRKKMNELKAKIGGIGR